MNAVDQPPHLNEHQQRALRTGLPVVANALTVSAALLTLAVQAARDDARPVFAYAHAATGRALRALVAAYHDLGLGPWARDQRLVLLEQVQRAQVALEDESGARDAYQPAMLRELAELRLLAARLESAVLNLHSTGRAGGEAP